MNLKQIKKIFNDTAYERMGGSAQELKCAEYIASLDMSAFVYDYDHNAPSVEHLQNTHEKFYNIIRAKNRFVNDCPFFYR